MRRIFVPGTIAALALVLGSCFTRTLPVPVAAAGSTPEPQPFAIYHEFFGSRGYSDPQVRQNLQLGMMNGLTFSPPVEQGMIQAAPDVETGLMLRLAGSPGPAGISRDEIERQRAGFQALARTNPDAAYTWNLLPEWDQSGGAWVPNGRPNYRTLTRAAASGVHARYYETNHPEVMNYLRQSGVDRNYALAAVTDYSPNVHLAYEMGVELQMLERGIDELGDLSTGIAFIRGAARQHKRSWGIDLSAWRTGNNKATEYDDSGILQGGWSAGYLLRHSYVSYLSGANVVHNEAASYRSRNGQLNPLGQVTRDFADFALRRHPDVGHTVVSVALLVPHDQGFDPKHGVFNQDNAVWYQDIPYSDGDFMMDNLLRVAYPNHWLHGLAPGAPFASRTGVPDATRFRSFLAAGGDPRPYEPMPFTRWGDNLDIITDHVTADVLAHYKVIVLAGDVHLSAQLRNDLAGWVRSGGALVMYAGQTSAQDQELLGASLFSGPSRAASTSRWLSGGPVQNETEFQYVLAQPQGAEVLAVANGGDPLILRNRVADGEVYLVTAIFGQAGNRSELVRAGVSLLDSLVTRSLPARVNGPPVEYIVNQGSGKILVALVNNASVEWTGEVVFQRPIEFRSVTEYITDQALPFRPSPIDIAVPVRVAPYEVRVVAVE